MVTTGAITFYQRGQTCNFSSDSVRAYVFQQLLCWTYVLTPSGSKVYGAWGFQPTLSAVVLPDFIKNTALKKLFEDDVFGDVTLTKIRNKVHRIKIADTLLIVFLK
jgi:hypothetical protein